MSIVFGQDFVVELNHFEAGQVQSFALETPDNGADKFALYGTRFDNYKCSLHRLIV